mgnify:CR=1 FL=1
MLPAQAQQPPELPVQAELPSVLPVQAELPPVISYDSGLIPGDFLDEFDTSFTEDSLVCRSLSIYHLGLSSPEVYDVILLM